MPKFIKGLQLSRDFYFEIVAPLLGEHFPDLQHSAARLGGGSDVLGFDDPTSRDHDWGPRVDLFFTDKDYRKWGQKVYDTLANTLPFTYQGYSTHFDNDYLMGENDQYPIIHRARTFSIDFFSTRLLGFDPLIEITEIDWLRTTEQQLRTIRSGEVFHDGLSKLNKIKKALHWYPDDIWIYLMACQWLRVDQEEPFMARCGDVGDELGSRVVAARQVKEIMGLCFYMEKEYAPYMKWFGTAFSKLRCAKRLAPLLQNVFLQETWRDREKVLSEVYLILAEMHNRLELTESIEPKISNFHDRPYLVPHSERFVEALLAKVKSPRLRSMKRAIGSLTQFIDSTDITCWNGALQKISSVYELAGE